MASINYNTDLSECTFSKELFEGMSKNFVIHSGLRPSKIKDMSEFGRVDIDGYEYDTPGNPYPKTTQITPPTPKITAENSATLPAVLAFLKAIENKGSHKALRNLYVKIPHSAIIHLKWIPCTIMGMGFPLEHLVRCNSYYLYKEVAERDVLSQKYFHPNIEKMAVFFNGTELLPTLDSNKADYPSYAIGRKTIISEVPLPFIQMPGNIESTGLYRITLDIDDQDMLSKLICGQKFHEFGFTSDYMNAPHRVTSRAVTSLELMDCLSSIEHLLDKDITRVVIETTEVYKAKLVEKDPQVVRFLSRLLKNKNFPLIGNGKSLYFVIHNCTVENLRYIIQVFNLMVKAPSDPIPFIKENAGDDLSRFLDKNNVFAVTKFAKLF